MPTGIATDSTTAQFFGDLVSKRRLVSLHDFQTGLGFFDRIGHARFKFCLITIGWNWLSDDTIAFSFFSRTIEEFADSRRHFRLSPRQIALVNPNTKTAPLFRSQHDANLTAGIYEKVPVLVNDTIENGNPWGISFLQGLFNMTSDSGLFTSTADFEADNPEEIGSGWETRWISDRQLDNVQLPLYEGKLIHHFDHRWATYSGPDSRDVTLTEKQTRTSSSVLDTGSPSEKLMISLPPRVGLTGGCWDGETSVAPVMSGQ